MIDDVVLGRPSARQVQSIVVGRHWPNAYRARDGRWRCRDCGLLLTHYLTMRLGVRRLRHHPRRRA